MKYEICKVNTSYGDKVILKDVSFTLEEKKITGIIGNNGCGKTTLLKSLVHLLNTDTCFEIRGKEFSEYSETERAALVGYLPQQSGLNIDITLLDTVLMGCMGQMKLFERVKKETLNRAKWALKIVGLEGLENKSILEVSAGQKQLCLLARVLVQNPELLLLDEPEGTLDFDGRYQLFTILKQLQKTVLMVLHDVNLALNYCDHLILMKEGRIVREIEPQKIRVTEMEEALNEIYNDVGVSKIQNENGSVVYSMYKRK